MEKFFLPSSITMLIECVRDRAMHSSVSGIGHKIREVIDLFEKLYKLFIFVFFFRVENNVTDEKILGMRKKVILIDLRRGHRMEQ